MNDLHINPPIFRNVRIGSGFDLSKHFAVLRDWARRANTVLQLARSHVTSEVSRERRNISIHSPAYFRATLDLSRLQARLCWLSESIRGIRRRKSRRCRRLSWWELPPARQGPAHALYQPLSTLLSPPERHGCNGRQSQKDQ